MKKITQIALVAAGLFVSGAAFSQACPGGTFGSNVCTPLGNLIEPGLYPKPDSLPCVFQGQYADITLQFKNFDSLEFGGQKVRIHKITVNSITNLPCGMCWSTNKSDNSWANQEDGCIRVAGSTNDPAGQYKLNITVSALLGTPPLTIPINNINADAAGLRYDVKVYTAGANCPFPQSIDTSITGLTAGTGCAVGINNPSSDISGVQITPNPVNSNAVVSFTAEKGGVYTETITDLVGRTVHTSQIEVIQGTNTTQINRGSLPAGVYFYNLRNGAAVVSKKFSISE